MNEAVPEAELALGLLSIVVCGGVLSGGLGTSNVCSAPHFCVPPCGVKHIRRAFVF